MISALVVFAAMAIAFVAGTAVGNDNEPEAQADGRHGGRDVSGAASGGDSEEQATLTTPPCERPPAEADAFFNGFSEDTHWEGVGTMRAPTSPDHGPGKTEDSGYRHCYANTPEGAVIAATNFIAMTDDPEALPEMLPDMLADGPRKDSALAEFEEEGPHAPEEYGGYIAGVKMLAYGHDRADMEVALVIEEQSRGMASIRVNLRWERGDWKVAFNDQGDLFEASLITSLDGYTLAG
ncbi:hypothetical protein GCM10009799_06340 [Nocardiopsis rhodophaea]|uniref:DUF8175 domain-containing protein n=2 Tax=Nocardiopsis rhodophaea TaxID=280238 RepID=A0ABP5DT77_9ACTN